MNVQTTCYCVVAGPNPVKPETTTIIGYYKYKQAAKDVLLYIKEIHLHAQGGVSVDIKKYKCELKPSQIGLCLEESNGTIAKIWDKLELDKDEWGRVSDIEFTRLTK